MALDAPETGLPTEVEVKKPSTMETVRPIEGIKSSVNNCTPDFRAKTVAEVDFDYLSELGIKTVVLDVDNTLTETGQSEIPKDILEALIHQKNKGTIEKIIIATDSRRDLSAVIAALGAEQIDTPLLRRKNTVHYWKNLVKKLAEHKCEPHQAVMIGDSPTWDMRGANRAGLVTILGEPFNDDPALIERLAFKTSGDRRQRKALELYGREQDPPIPHIPSPRSGTGN